MSHISARERSRQQNSGSGMMAHLAPSTGVRDEARRHGRKVVNHAAENRRALRELESRNREEKLRAEEEESYFKNRAGPYEHAQSKLYDERVTSAPRREFLRKSEGMNNATRRKTPVRTRDEEYYEYDNAPKPSVPKGLQARAPKQTKNFLAKNRQTAGSSKPKKKQVQGGKDFTNRDYGQVPAYLKNRKQEMAEYDAYQRQLEEEADLPAGMILMPEDERVETLTILKEKKKALEAQIRTLPLKIETLGQKKRQADLDGKLKEIEGALVTFGKKKVYITMD